MVKENYDDLLKNIQNLKVAGELESALLKAREAVHRNRLNLRANLLLAEVLYDMQNWLESYQYYTILLSLQQSYKEEVITNEELRKRIEIVEKDVLDIISGFSMAEQEECKALLADMKTKSEYLQKNAFQSLEEIQDMFGEHMVDGKIYYFGRYADWFGSYFKGTSNGNAVSSKVCVMEVEKKGTEYQIEGGVPVLLPVVINPNGDKNTVTIEKENEKISFRSSVKKTFSYYRIEEPVRITSDEPMVFAKPISLKQNKKTNKKLVLNIFLDSFNWYFFKKKSLEELMPHTYDFFKEGVICEQFYSGSEFTYPSVASYFTGLRPTNHMLLNQNVHFSLLPEHTLLPEIFRDAGYYVSKIGGNDSVAPNYGYLRGVDRFVIGRAEQNFRVQDAVYEAIEQLEALPERSQFMWLEIQDLHEVAGYWEMPFSVQSNVNFETNVVDNLGGSSLYQTPSPNRRDVYAKQLKRIDLQLNALYSYVKDHYNKEEVIITMISDHGNGFNVDANQPFMSEQRTNIPLMIYGGNVTEHICNEKIETIDYGHIVCKLAQVSADCLRENDGQLPLFFGGNKEKSYAFSQSLFPDRHYEAAIIGNGFQFYFQSEKLAGNDCRIDISSGAYMLMDNDAQIIENPQLVNVCLKIISTHLGDYKL